MKVQYRLPNCVAKNGALGPGPSPLQHFVQAKKKINEIFREVDGYVSETEQFLVNIPADTGVAEKEVQEAAKEFGKK